MTQLATPTKPKNRTRNRLPQNRTQRLPVATPIPVLQNGDHLTRVEFERRYDAMPNLKKAELIEGVVYLDGHLGGREFGFQRYDMIGWMGQYSSETPGLIGAINSTVRLDMENELQPDAFLIIDPAAGGQTRIDEVGYISGAPELVVEISASSESYDLHVKLAVYRRNGVQEYITWRVLDNQIDWRVLRDGVYVLLEPDSHGLSRSEVLPGLTLDSAALIKGNTKTVIKAQRAALKSAKYREFAGRLAKVAHHA